MSKSKHTEAQMIAAVKQMEAKSSDCACCDRAAPAVTLIGFDDSVPCRRACYAEASSANCCLVLLFRRGS